MRPRPFEFEPGDAERTNTRIDAMENTMRRLLAFAVAFLALPGLGAAPLSSNDGWTDLHWGMDKEKIVTFYPAAHFTASSEIGSTYADLGELELTGGKYAVHAVILDGKRLTSVRISTLGRKEILKRHEVLAMVSKLRDELILKYGPPSSKEINSLTWRRERVHIALGWVGKAGLLMLTYRNPATISSPRP
jgi:hypothetical protein